MKGETNTIERLIPKAIVPDDITGQATIKSDNYRLVRRKNITTISLNIPIIYSTLNLFPFILTSRRLFIILKCNFKETDFRGTGQYQETVLNLHNVQSNFLLFNKLRELELE